MLETAILVSNVTIGVLMIVFGFWIRHIVNQQLKLKDATIESKDAEISRLKSEAAPNIAEAYTRMRQHADEMTEKFNKLQEESSKLRQQIVEETISSLKTLQVAVETLVAKSKN